jgi:uncharacterized MnhB-related membrane protein
MVGVLLVTLLEAPDVALAEELAGMTSGVITPWV